MARHSSATPREESSDIRNASPKIKATANVPPNSNRFPTSNAAPKNNDDRTIIDASIKRRARLLVIKSSIPKQTRSLIRYALQIKDPYLAQVVRRVEAGEMVINCLYVE